MTMDFDNADYQLRAESKLQEELSQLQATLREVQAKVQEVQAKVQEEARLHEEARDERVAALESRPTAVVPRPKESQCPTNGDLICPPPPSAADPHGEGNAADEIISCYGKVQRIVYETVVEPPEGYCAGNIFGLLILVLIMVNIVVGVLETVPELFAKYETFFYYFEFVSVVIFTAEYVLMLWSCVADPQFGSRGLVCGRIKAATRPLAMVDILAIAPFYLSSLVQVDLRFIRILRLFRLFRLFRAGKMAESFRIMSAVIMSKREQLTLGLMLLTLIVLLVSSVMYIIEQDQPNTKFTSIPASMWWGVVTITTIGYGDMVPASTFGKVFGSFVGFLGICVFAIPVGIIGAGYIECIDLCIPTSEAGTGGRTAPQVASGTGSESSNIHASSGDRAPTAQRTPSTQLETSAAAMSFTAEETLDSVLESQPISVVPNRPQESQCPTNGDLVCPPPPSAADPHGEVNAADEIMSCYGKVQRIVYETVVEPPEGYHAGNIFGSSILVIIVVNIVVGVLETVPELFAKYETFFYYFEFVSVMIFTVEYILMLWSCVADPQFGSRGLVCGRIKAATRPLAMVDILAITPFYLSSMVKVDLRFVRILRLFRLFRLFRARKMAESFRVMSDVVTRKREQLTLGVMLLTLIVLLVSSVMYIIEQDQRNTKFTSIPASMWWGIISITTIGYGDMVPASPLGKVFASFVGFLGICGFAIPVGIIGCGFIENSTPTSESGTGGHSEDRTHATQRAVLFTP